MRKDFYKRIMSLLLSGTLFSSTLPTMVNANGYDDEVSVANYYATSEKDVNVCRLKGVYTVLVNEEPVYVYLGNSVPNLYLEKTVALEIGKANYKSVNAFKKTILNPTYVQGVSDPNDKFLTVYAISENKSVNGWENVSLDSLSLDTLVATSIELGEYILKCVDLADYNTNKVGYGNIDINKDGVANEIVYFGNNKLNTALLKNDAFKFAAANYGTYYIQARKVLIPDSANPGKQKTVTIYAVSENAFVPGWNRVSKDSVPNDAKVGTTTVYMEAVTAIYSAEVIEETIHITTVNNNPSYPVSDGYNAMLKEEAYAYATYSDFCILGKAVVNPRTNEKEILYAFSSTLNVPGWLAIGNDFIPNDALIYLSMQDAYNREYDILNGFSKNYK